MSPTNCCNRPPSAGRRVRAFARPPGRWKTRRRASGSRISGPRRGCCDPSARSPTSAACFLARTPANDRLIPQLPARRRFRCTLWAGRRFSGK
jgi:hypothetical protein